MQYMIDLVYPPSNDTALLAQQLQWSKCNVYIGGRRAYGLNKTPVLNPWQSQIERLTSYFDGFLCTYVGLNWPWDRNSSLYTLESGTESGRNACLLASSFGFKSDAAICLDIEAATSLNIPFINLSNFVAGFVGACNNQLFRAGVYGVLPFVTRFQIGEEVDFTWAGSPREINQATDYNAPIGLFDPSDPPFTTGWQFGNGSINGDYIDYNSFDDFFVFSKYG